ncbi:MAG: hypothetical protein H3C58_05830 [Fimbriimonadaceae bacterium]|nr:hypothetical protein [Fimbriimonadaceae bacterium]
MWLFTKHGFFSAVCAWQGDGTTHQPMDPDRVVVRARVQSHLEALKRRFPEQLGACDILSSPNRDYPYRIVVAKPEWTSVLAGLAEELDYDNFKGEVRRLEGSTPYERALHKVWGVMNKLPR